MRGRVNTKMTHRQGLVETGGERPPASLRGMPRGAVFIPFCFYEAAANLLTNPALDPFGKIPEFKYCAVKVMRGGELTPRSSYGGGQAFAALDAA